MLATCIDDDDFTPWPKGVTEKPKDARDRARRRQTVHNPKRSYDRTRTYCSTCRCVTGHSCPYGPPFRLAPSVYCLACMTLNPTSCQTAADRKACKMGHVHYSRKLKKRWRPTANIGWARAVSAAYQRGKRAGLMQAAKLTTKRKRHL